MIQYIGVIVWSNADGGTAIILNVQLKDRSRSSPDVPNVDNSS